jgi:hypothetical protein
LSTSDATSCVNPTAPNARMLASTIDCFAFMMISYLPVSPPGETSIQPAKAP